MPKKIILTIDDSPSTVFDEMLSFLNSLETKAIFFCRGDRIKGSEKSLIKAIHHGHIIGNHAFSHKHFSNLTLIQCLEEVTSTHKLIDDLYCKAGVKSYPKLFRFPYGDKGDFKYGHHFWPFKKAWAHHQSKLTKLKYPTFAASRYLSRLEQEGVERKKQIQEHLQNLNYQPIPSDLVLQNFFVQFCNDIDWLWTLDVGEWQWYSKITAPNVLSTILSQLYSTQPFLGFGTIAEPHSLQSSTSYHEILLIHDHSDSLIIFKEIIKSLRKKDFIIYLPKLNP